MILAIDTSTALSGVALFDENAGAAGRVAAVRRARVTTHSESLLGMVKEALDEAGVAVRDLAAIACSGGPGSFTGLRIGLATAKGLCLATGKPLLLVPSLQVLAMRAPPGATTVVGCLDAFKGEVYAAWYEGGLPPARLRDDEVLPPARLAERLSAWLAEHPGAPPIHLVGDGAARWSELRIPGVDASDVEPPDPIDLARLAAHRLARGEEDDLAGASPRYVRASEAELLAAMRRPTQ